MFNQKIKMINLFEENKYYFQLPQILKIANEFCIKKTRNISILEFNDIQYWTVTEKNKTGVYINVFDHTDIRINQPQKIENIYGVHKKQ